MPRTLVLFGGNSLVGSHFAERMAGSVRLLAIGRTDPRARGIPVDDFVAVDLGDEAELRTALSTRSTDVAWVNFVARTDVDGCEQERADGPEPGDRSELDRPGSAWRVNAALPEWLAEEAARSGTPFVHLSTDFVFDGRSGPYRESDPPSPWSPCVSWYGWTKGVGEARVRASHPRASILRISYPYRSRFVGKLDFARGILARARTGTLYPLYADQTITPTWIPDVSEAIRALSTTPRPGTFHVASPEVTTPAEFGRTLLQAFGIPTEGLREARLADAETGSPRAPRPLHGGLKVDTVRALGPSPMTFREGIARMRLELGTG